MYHKGKDYEEIDKMALQIRIDYGHFEKKLNVFKLAKQLNIVLIKYSSLNEEQLDHILNESELKDGLTIIKKRNGEYKYITFYNDKLGMTRRRLTIGHEIKHVVYLEEDPSEKDEDLANHFARYILAPTCLIMPYVMKKSSILEIIEDFGISKEAAQNAYSQAENRITSGNENLTDIEKEFMAGYKKQL